MGYIMEEENQTRKIIKDPYELLKISILLVLTCIVSMISGLLLGDKFLYKKDVDNIPNELKDVIDSYNYIIENFYEDIDKKEIINGAISGMLESLGDKYTIFLEQEMSETFNIHLNGSFTGIGVEIAKVEEGIKVMNVIENSPASKVDLRSGDIFLELDGVDFSDKEASDFTDAVKKKNNNFTILIKRGEELITKELYKDLILLQSVSSKMYEENNKKIGYIEIELFASNTYEQFKQELKKLEKEKIDGLIIDVRWNTGGHLSSVERILSLFLDSSHVIYQMEGKDGTTKTYSTGTITKQYPIILLSNGGSASASELLMGTLRDELKAKIVGTKSFGKGTVQELNKLSSQDQYKLTTRKWLTSKGKSVDGIGLEPDLVVEQDLEYYESGEESKDKQLKEALKLIVES